MAPSASRKTKAKTKSKTKARISTKRKIKIPKRAAKKAKVKTKTKPKAKKKAPKAKKLVKKAVAKRSLPKVAAIRREIVAPVVVPTASRVAAGDIAPTFTLADQNGNLVSLTDLKGKKVVLYFYPKDDTPGCTKEACSFRDHLPTFQGADAEIFGVSFDDQASHQKFIEKYQLTFSLLSDLNREVADAYGCYVEKNMYGNISKGIERSTFVIDREGKIAAAFRKVSVDGHTEEVLEALRQIN